MKIVKTRGNSYERGFQYGKQCKEIIQRSINGWYRIGAASLTPGFRNRHPKLIREMIPAFLLYKRKINELKSFALKYEDVIEKCNPKLITTMNGIADGANVNYQDILYLNTFPEIVLGCSSWGSCGKASKDGKTYLGMNTDEEGVVENLQIILREQLSNGREIMGVTYAGIITPFNGVTSDDMGFLNHLLITEKQQTPTETLPIFIALAEILYNHSTVEEIVDSYKAFPSVECASIFLFATKREIMRIENIATLFDITHVQDNTIGSCMRPLSKKIQPFDATKQVAPSFQANAIPRNQRMNELLKKHFGKFNTELMMKIASDHGENASRGKSICQHSRFGVKTISTSIIKPESRKMWIFAGNPCKSNYIEYKINN